ncbi:MAG: hypothetical protein AB7N70_35220 [Dehalococcoidia bacterium]
MIARGVVSGGDRSKRASLVVATLAFVVFGCGGSPAPSTEMGKAAPAAGEPVDTWSETRVREALARHGQVNGDAWTSAYWGVDEAHERMITLEGIHVAFESLTDASTTAARGNAWKGRITLSALRHRFADDPAREAGWTSGAGPLSKRVLYVRRKRSGRVLWATAPVGAAPVPDEVYSPDERDVLASLLQEFQAPHAQREQRVIARRIASVLRQDAETLQQSGAGVAGRADANALYIKRIESVDLSGLPAEFVAAYRAHVAAWRGGEKSRIEASWASVAGIANEYGVGTYN